MPRIFEKPHTVEKSEIDFLDHVNNQVYLSWFNELAIGHSTAQGWPSERHIALGAGWVVRKHELEYLIALKAGEQVTLRTWIATAEKASSVRRYEVVRQSDGKIAARGSTLWVWVDYKTGRPCRVPPDVVADFELVPDNLPHR
jgi:acyl-CoA thioester hydrolase